MRARRGNNQRYSIGCSVSFLVLLILLLLLNTTIIMLFVPSSTTIIAQMSSIRAPREVKTKGVTCDSSPLHLLLLLLIIIIIVIIITILVLIVLFIIIPMIILFVPFDHHDNRPNDVHEGPSTSKYENVLRVAVLLFLEGSSRSEDERCHM